MKKAILISNILILIAISFGFTKNMNMKSEKECTVYVKWYSKAGKPAVDKKVEGRFDDRAFSAEGTNTAYTDKNGKVTLRWNSYKDLINIFVDGTGHKGTYVDGGTYTFVLK